MSKPSKLKSDCIFCSQHGVIRGKEHVIPSWLLKHLGWEKQKFLLQFNKRLDAGLVTRDRPGIFNSTLQRNHALPGLVSGGICKRCNEGWMSRLETQVKSIVVPLISTERVVANLSPSQSFILARWAVKTAYALDFATANPAITPTDHPRHLYSYPADIPQNVMVFAVHSVPPHHFDFYISSDWSFLSQNEVQTSHFLEARKTSYKISFQLSSLHLAVVFLDSPHLRIAPRPGMHQLLFPNDADVRYYENTDLLESMKNFPSHTQQRPTYHNLFHLGIRCVAADPLYGTDSLSQNIPRTQGS